MTRPASSAQSDGPLEILVLKRETLLRQELVRRREKQRIGPRVRHDGVDLEPCTPDCPACREERSEIELLNRLAGQ